MYINFKDYIRLCVNFLSSIYHNIFYAKVKKIIISCHKIDWAVYSCNRKSLKKC